MARLARLVDRCAQQALALLQLAVQMARQKDLLLLQTAPSLWARLSLLHQVVHPQGVPHPQPVQQLPVQTALRSVREHRHLVPIPWLLVLERLRQPTTKLPLVPQQTMLLLQVPWK